jgi:hypothetical protein
VTKAAEYTHLSPVTYNENNSQQVHIPVVSAFDTFWKVTLQYEPENNVFSLISAIELSETFK